MGKTIPAYERYRTESARMAGGIPEPAGTDVWRDIVLPKVAGMAISKGIGLGASASAPSKVVSGSGGGGGGSSLSTGEALEEGGLDALTHSLIEKLMGGRGFLKGIPTYRHQPRSCHKLVLRSRFQGRSMRSVNAKSSRKT